MPRITVILSDEEYVIIKGKAGLIPLSRWIRNIALEVEDGESEDHREKDVRRDKEVRVSVERADAIESVVGTEEPSRSEKPKKKLKPKEDPSNLMCKHKYFYKLCPHEECRRG